MTVDPNVLRELLPYAPETGMFVWLPRQLQHFRGRYHYNTPELACKAWNTRYAGTPAFRVNNGRGYFSGTVFGQTIKAHRAAWAMYYGVWPNTGIDHIDGDPGNNRIANLRCVAQRVNAKNACLPKNNTSGVIGVSWHKAARKWTAIIIADGQRHHLGFFTNFEDAKAARRDAERRFGFHPNHGRKSFDPEAPF